MRHHDGRRKGQNGPRTAPGDHYPKRRDGMDGAFHMSPDWLAGSACLINLDNEASDQVVASTAAGDVIIAGTHPSFTAASGNLPLNIEISGLAGGHSGIDIDKGRLNGIIALARFLRMLEEQHIGFELAAFSGGSANNAIPEHAECLIVMDSADEEKVKEMAADYCSGLREAYVGIEENITFRVAAAENMSSVVSAHIQRNIIRYMTEIINGIYTMSPDMEGLVESSSNLGLVSLNEEDGFRAGNYLRSSVLSLEDEIMNAQLQLAGECELETETFKTSLPWTYDPDSRLLALAQETYRALTGEEIQIVAVHAGLECGTFKVLNPSLDMICIGPDLTDVHTTGETLHLDTLPNVWHLLEGLLAGVDE